MLLLVHVNSRLFQKFRNVLSSHGRKRTAYKMAEVIFQEKRAAECSRRTIYAVDDRFFFFSMALPAHSGPWPLIQFRNHFSQTVGLLGRVISPTQGRYLHTGQHKH
jgi:hypothetical protein